MSRARALMVLGTASSVGKSLTVTALCRILRDDGIDVAPFKAQNMSLNAAVTPDGREIGRAQAVQAEAARRPAEVEMNPILLKPSGDRRSQVVLEGDVWRDVDAWEYHRSSTAALFPRVCAAYERLAARCGLIVLEGAGSPAEINLRSGDIVNLRMAEAADAACILVADIDRGGVFAALAGTLLLLEPHERARIKAFVITKFRGDRALLDPGIAMAEQRLGIPCAGVIPWIERVGIDEEDAYGTTPLLTAWPAGGGADRPLNVAVIAYPFAANMTDLDALAAEPAVALRRAAAPGDLAGADVVVLPGSKETVRDLRWLREGGFAAAIAAHAQRAPVIGLCGGMQMLGMTLRDPHAAEGGGDAEGLGLLPLSTSFGRRKTTLPVRGRLAAAVAPPEYQAFHGYEIHLGTTVRDGGAPFALVRDADGGAEREDGAVAGNVSGTYVHGLFDDDAFRHAAVDAWRSAAALAPAAARNAWQAEREARYDRLAAEYRGALNMPLVMEIAGLPVREAAGA